MAESGACVNKGGPLRALCIPHWPSWETVWSTCQLFLRGMVALGWLLTCSHSALIENHSWDAVTQMPLVCVELLTVTSGVTGEDTLCRAEMASAAAALSIVQVAHCTIPGGPLELGIQRECISDLKKRQQNILSH